MTLYALASSATATGCDPKHNVRAMNDTIFLAPSRCPYSCCLWAPLPLLMLSYTGAAPHVEVERVAAPTSAPHTVISRPRSSCRRMPGRCSHSRSSCRRTAVILSYIVLPLRAWYSGTPRPSWCTCSPRIRCNRAHRACRGSLYTRPCVATTAVLGVRADRHGVHERRVTAAAACVVSPARHGVLVLRYPLRVCSPCAPRLPAHASPTFSLRPYLTYASRQWISALQ